MSQSHQAHRPYSLLIPPNPAYTPTSPRGGILLNAARGSTSAPLSPFTPPSSSSSGLWPGTYTPRSPSPLSAALSPDGTQTNHRQSINSSLGSRKIRFAPLPEPRRDVMVDENGSELPCSATYPADATSFPVQSPGAGSSVPLDRTDSLVTDSGASTASTENDTQSQTARKKAKGNSLLRIFGMGGSSLAKKASTSSLPTADSNGTIGGIPVPGLGLFRASSRESWTGEPSGYTSDNSMSRRMSSPLRPESSTRKPAVQPNYGSYGAPLMHAASDGSGTAQRPQRMLNGRVYGAKRAKERLQPQPSMEPEFSEWGYGGMGSVSTSGEYGKLQSNASSIGGARGGDDDDDGSGMTWIRKRREKREQEARERKAAEEAAAAAEAAKAGEESAETGSETRASTETAHSTPTIHAEPTDITTLQSPTGEISSPVPASPGNIQPPRTNSSPQPARISHSRNTSRQNSVATITAERHVPTVISVPAHAHRGRHQDAAAPGTGAKNSETSPDRSSSDSSQPSSDDEDAEGSSSTTGRDEDEEEEEENQKRKTALSAGIEKISRHHA